MQRRWFNDWDDAGPAPTGTSRLWVTCDVYDWDLLWHREAVLSGLGTFWKRSVSRSFLGVFLGCFGFLVGFWFVVFCVCVVLKTPSFLLSPVLQHEGIANQRQNVLMTVRASSAHGVSSKKISSGAHSFLHDSFIWALLHTGFRLSLLSVSQLLPIFSLGLHVLACPQEHLLSYFDAHTLSPCLKFSWGDLHVSLSVL